MTKVLSAAVGTVALGCALAQAQEGNVTGLAQRPPSELLPALERIVVSMDELSGQEKEELFVEISAVLDRLPAVGETEPSGLSENDRQLIQIQTHCFGVLAQLSLEGDSRASVLLREIQRGRDYWGRVLAGTAVEFVDSQTDHAGPPTGRSRSSFAEYHCELERAVADTSLARERRIWALDEALRDCSSYRDESRSANRQALLLLLRQGQVAEEEPRIREMMLKLYVDLAAVEDSRSLLSELIASPETPAQVRTRAQYCRRLLELRHGE